MSWKLPWYRPAQIACLLFGNHGDLDGLNTRLSDPSEFSADDLKRLVGGGDTEGLINLLDTFVPLHATFRPPDEDTDGLKIRIVAFEPTVGGDTHPATWTLALDNTTLYVPSDRFAKRVRDIADAGKIDWPTGALRVHPIFDAYAEIIECDRTTTSPDGGYKLAIQRKASSTDLGMQAVYPKYNMWIGKSYMKPGPKGPTLVLGQSHPRPAAKAAGAVKSPDWPCGAITGRDRCPRTSR